MQEIWNEVLGYETRYKISNIGRVLSLKTNKIMKSFDNGNGYCYISLLNEKGRKNKYIHRLVAEAFIPNPNCYKEINHLNYNKKDNQVDNLEWCTRKENINYSIKNRSKFCGKDNNCKSEHKYIFKRKDNYEVTVRRKYLGRFESLEKAIMVRDKEIKRICQS